MRVSLFFITLSLQPWSVRAEPESRLRHLIPTFSAERYFQSMAGICFSVGERRGGNGRGPSRFVRSVPAATSLDAAGDRCFNGRERSQLRPPRGSAGRLLRGRRKKVERKGWKRASSIWNSNREATHFHPDNCTQMCTVLQTTLHLQFAKQNVTPP